MSKTQFFQKLNDIPIADIWERLGGAKPDRNGKVLCKFHIEDTPSAQIGGRRNTYHCYSCGITLGAWDLVKRVCNITENRDIFKWFEDKFGLTGDPPPAKVRKRAGAKKGEKDMTIDDAKTAMDFTWRDDLLENEEAMGLLAGYGLRRHTVEEAGLGLYEHPTLGLGVVYPCPDKNDPVAFKFRSLSRDRDGKRSNLVIAGEIGGAMYGLNSLVFGDAVHITGGEEKWLLLRQEGRVAVSWATGEGSRGLEQLKAIIAVKPTQIVLCYDADEAGARAAAATAEALRGLGYSGFIKRIDWDDGLPKGYDVNNAYADRQLETYLNQLVSVEVAPKEINLFCGKKGGFMPALAANIVLDACPNLINVEGTWFEYDAGIYHEVWDEEIRGRIARLMGDRATSRYINEVVDLMRIHPERFKRRAIWEDEVGKICAANCYLTYDNSRINIHAHTPDVRMRYKTPVDFDPSAECPRFMQLLDEIFPDKPIHRLIKQWFGYCLTEQTKHQVAMLWVGEGANGKGVLSHILTALVGAERVGHLRMSQLNKDFLVGTLYGKTLNIASESKGSAGKDNVDEVVKQFVHADAAIQADEKYKRPFDFLPKAKWIFCLNDMHYSPDSSRGYWRSFIAVPFKITFFNPNTEEVPKGAPVMDKELYSTILNELKGILNWALDGLVDLNKNGFCVPQICRDYLNTMREESNSVLLFVRDECKIHPELLASKKGLYKEYKNYCIAHGHYVRSLTSFSREIIKSFGKTHKIGEGRTAKGMIFRGINLTEEVDGVLLQEIERRERESGFITDDVPESVFYENDGEVW